MTSERQTAMKSMSVLDDTERQALAQVLDDEYKAHTTYRRVIDDFGPVRPFVNIRIDGPGRFSVFQAFMMPVWRVFRAKSKMSRSMTEL